MAKRNFKGSSIHQQNFKKVEVGIKDQTFIFEGPLTVLTFAEKLKKPLSEIIKYFFMKGIPLSPNSMLNEEQIAEVCLEYDLDFQKQEKVDETNYFESIDEIIKKEDKSKWSTRAPIVTIMGHVDHGKTTLLDTIRNSRVVEREFGGITQHIGAYQVKHDGTPITFIDTPGHEAFTKMRSRGANVTDIVILVVAADDGVMPQTEEAIDHARAANVPILVFINKMDKAGANPDKIMSLLSERDLLAEEWGGKTIYIKGSALKKEGIKELLDSIVLLAEINEYKANADHYAVGIVLESHLDKGLGPVATFLIQTGTLNVGDIIIAGHAYGKIRSIKNDLNTSLKSALPSMPVMVSGLDIIPDAGDKFIVFQNEQFAKALLEKRMIKTKESELADKFSTTQEEAVTNEEGEKVVIKSLNLIIKTDTHGSTEAIRGMISKMTLENAKVNIIRSAAGQVTESDILLAKTSSAYVFAFNIRPSAQVRDAAKKAGIEIRIHNIVYKLKEEVESLLKGILDPKFENNEMGEARVLKTFKHSEVGTIAGCMVTSGVIKRKAKARVVRDGIVIFESEIDTLKRFKEDAREVKKDTECGLTIARYNDLKEGDVIEAYSTDVVER